MIDLTGKRFGYLTVIKEGNGYRSLNGKPNRTWICKCDCGNITEVRQNNLTRKEYQTVSCGCYAIKIRSETAKETFTTHGYSKERLYRIWCGIIRRCEKPYDCEYDRYGGRGISVCEEWHDYVNFRKWALNNGYDPNAKRGLTTIDRINNDGNYSPDNCKISNMIEQANNTSSVNKYYWEGKLMTLTEIINNVKPEVSRTCIYKRLRKGMSISEAVLTPYVNN